MVPLLARAAPRPFLSCRTDANNTLAHGTRTPSFNLSKQKTKPASEAWKEQDLNSKRNNNHVGAQVAGRRSNLGKREVVISSNRRQCTTKPQTKHEPAVAVGEFGVVELAVIYDAHLFRDRGPHIAGGA